MKPPTDREEMKQKNRLGTFSRKLLDGAESLNYILKTSLFKYTENFITKKMKIFK